MGQARRRCREDSLRIAACGARLRGSNFVPGAAGAPDTSSYGDSEIVYRVKKYHHAGFILKSPHEERIRELLDSYTKRFTLDFLATQPVPTNPLLKSLLSMPRYSSIPVPMIVADRFVPAVIQECRPRGRTSKPRSRCCVREVTIHWEGIELYRGI